MKIKIEKSWRTLLQKEFNKDYFQNLITFVENEYSTKTIFPPANQIFSAFNTCPVDKVKVVIIGQDPYHGTGQANGMCFSVNKGIKIPPSLRNIYKEIESDIGRPSTTEGDLTYWAKQGILLLNATLTVRESDAGSHQKMGWEEFTDASIKLISKNKENLVFLLWGNYAKSKTKLINQNKNHLILTATHPSPFSAHSGFFGCKHFSKANQFLSSKNLDPINW